MNASAIHQALELAGAGELPASSRAWMRARLDVYGYDVDAQNLGGLRPAGFGDVGRLFFPGVKVPVHKPPVRRPVPMQTIAPSPYGYGPTPWDSGDYGPSWPGGELEEFDDAGDGGDGGGDVEGCSTCALRVMGEARRAIAVFPSLEVGAAALVDVARRAGATREHPAPDLAPLVGWWPGMGPSDEATTLFQKLRADWVGFEAQGAARVADLKTDVTEWHAFKDAWESADIDSSDIGGRLTAETIRANRVRARLLEEATGKPVNVWEAPGYQQGLDVTQATNAAKQAVPIDTWAKNNALLNWITNPTQGITAAATKAIALAVGAFALVAIATVALTHATQGRR